MTVVVAEHQTPHPKPLRGSGDRRERGQRGELVAERLLDEMIAEQKRREARPLGATSRFHELGGRADVLAQESEAKSVRTRHASASSGGLHCAPRPNANISTIAECPSITPRCPRSREWDVR